MIARDDSEALAALAEDSGLEYPLLHDAEGETVIRYGLRNEGFTRGVLPHPTVLVIDEEGKVRYKRVDVDYTQRPPAEDLVVAVEALRPASD